MANTGIKQIVMHFAFEILCFFRGAYIFAADR
jgi:hypothetical protein